MTNPKIKNIKSYKDLEQEKLRLFYKAKIAEKELELSLMKIHQVFSPHALFNHVFKFAWQNIEHKIRDFFSPKHSKRRQEASSQKSQ